MNKIIRRILLLLAILPMLTGCFEIREDLQFNSSGGGSYQLTMDFSKSRALLEMIITASKDEKVNPFGMEGNPFKQVDSLFLASSSQLNSITGIRNANSLKDDRNFQYGLRFEFESTEALNTALSEIQYNADAAPSYERYYNFSKGVINKTDAFNLRALTAKIKPDDKVDDFGREVHSKIQEMYDNITYAQSIRFDRVKKFSNTSYALSADKTTLTFTRSLRELQSGNVNIANEISFK